MTASSSVRITKFRSRSDHRSATRHALRQDVASHRRLRRGAVLGAGLAFSSRIHDGADGTDFDIKRNVTAAFDAHRRRHGIATSKQSGLGFHAIVSVSAEWVAAGGGLHDPANPRNRALFNAAVAWMESWCGRGSVYAGRVDLDETGGGNVDLFVMPVSIDGRNGKPTISTSKALTELRLKHDERMSHVAMQTDWAEFCQQHLDPEIERGKPKAQTRAEHLEVEAFKDAKSEARRRINAAVAEAEENAAHIRLLLAHLRKFELDLEDRAVLRFFEAETDAAVSLLDGVMPGLRL